MLNRCSLSISTILPQPSPPPPSLSPSVCLTDGRVVDTALPLPLERPGACSKDPSLCFTPFPSLLSISLFPLLCSSSPSLSPLQHNARKVGSQDIKQALERPLSCRHGAGVLSDLSSLSFPPPSSYHTSVNADVPSVSAERIKKHFCAFFILRSTFPLTVCLSLGLVNWLKMCKLVSSFLCLAHVFILPLLCFSPHLPSQGQVSVSVPCEKFLLRITVLCHLTMFTKQSLFPTFASISLSWRQEAKLD